MGRLAPIAETTIPWNVVEPKYDVQHPARPGRGVTNAEQRGEGIAVAEFRHCVHGHVGDVKFLVARFGALPAYHKHKTANFASYIGQ
mgnify:CR=1 FL=1